MKWFIFFSIVYHYYYYEMNAISFEQLVVGEKYYLELPPFRYGEWETNVFKVQSTLLSIKTRDTDGEISVVFGNNIPVHGICGGDIIGTRGINRHRNISNRTFKFIYNSFNKQLYSDEIKRLTELYMASASQLIAEIFTSQYNIVYRPMKDVLIRRKEDRLINNVLQYITQDPFFVWA